MSTARTLFRLTFTVPILVMGAGLSADPAAPAPSAPVIQYKYRVSRMPYGAYGQQNRINPGSNIPPCEMVFGYTSRGPTDQNGHLLTGPAASLPQWTFTTTPAKSQCR